MAGEIGFFELGVEDAEKGRRFYEGLFGWRFEPGPSSSGWSISTAGVPGGMHGGDRAATPYVFFAVDEIDTAIARVKELGGQVLDMDVEGDAASLERFGRFKLCTDDQGSSRSACTSGLPDRPPPVSEWPEARPPLERRP